MGHTVADQLVGGLIAAGVARIYGLVGDSRNAVVGIASDLLRKPTQPRIGGMACADDSKWHFEAA